MENIYETNIVENILRLYSKKTFSYLLKDRTTRKNIIWATDEYKELGQSYFPSHEIMAEDISNFHTGVIKPRITKAVEAQLDRTKKKAEVFTPSWICNKMNNAVDEDWFGRKDVFNIEQETTWIPNNVKIEFRELSWKKYVDNRRLEITCGEGPFITSRYDTTTGEFLPLNFRIGFLDRKLRIVSENTSTEKEWLKWALRALQSTYGYEYQGDNLLIARFNVMQTFTEYMENKWQHKPDEKTALKAAKIISWNLWQMDGLKGTVPLGMPQQSFSQISIFDLMNQNEVPGAETIVPYCKIFDWRNNESQTYVSMKGVV